MLEVKVHCDCGQKYKFDVEPVNGRMPFTVACPICGADGTAKANAILQESIVYQIPAGPSMSPPPLPPPPPPPYAPAPLRVPASSYAAAPSSAAPPPISPVATPVPLARPMTPFARQAAAGAPAKSDRKSSFAMGLLGGVLGVLVAGTIYYLVFKFTGLPLFGFKSRLAATFLALGMGGLAGWGAEMLGRGEGSKELGLITATLVVAGVIGAQYLVALDWWHKITHEFEDIGFTAMVEEAKTVVKAIPTGSDAEIRLYLARETASDGDVVKPASVSDEDVKTFKEKELPEYQSLASGKLTKGQYFAKHGIDTKKLKQAEDSAEDSLKGLFVLLLVSKAGIFSLIASAGLAYKLSTNA